MFKAPTATTTRSFVYREKTRRNEERKSEQTSFTTHNQLFQPWEFLVCFSTDD